MESNIVVLSIVLGYLLFNGTDLSLQPLVFIESARLRSCKYSKAGT